MRTSRKTSAALQLSLESFLPACLPEPPTVVPLVREPSRDPPPPDDDLPDCMWSPSVALDRKHRPQVFDEPSSTVRREWCRYPQEAHLLDERNNRYRRLTVQEIAVLQGFDPESFDVPGLSNRARIKAIGDAVPPPLAAAVVGGMDAVWPWTRRTAVEVCAGAGGLGSGAARAGFAHLRLVERWAPACAILRSRTEMFDPESVVEADVKSVSFDDLRDRVGLLSGGPPCQPWSQGGLRRGVSDPRDLLAWIHELVSMLRPEAFVFENVPGLTTELHAEYRTSILESLRSPGRGAPRYGVMAGVLNAADFGVPQIRRRVFIIGFREAPNALAYKALDRIYARATHRDPAVPHSTRLRWRTVGDALGARPDPGGWRKWITAKQS